MMGILETIHTQIEEAATDLGKYRPNTVDWKQRTRSAAEQLISWLVVATPGLKLYVEGVLNAPVTLRLLWKSIRMHVQLPTEQLEAFDQQLKLDEVLRDSLTGETVSNVVSRYLIERHPDSSLRSNGRSDYPDLYDSTQDYSALPVFKRKTKDTAEDEYGASLKGKQRRPVRVPDGLEIKTCRDRISVDCHHPHAGLHLVVLFRVTAHRYLVDDVLLAFLRAADYRESARNTTATTVKYSFGGDRFVSLLG